MLLPGKPGTEYIAKIAHRLNMEGKSRYMRWVERMMREDERNLILPNVMVYFRDMIYVYE